MLLQIAQSAKINSPTVITVIVIAVIDARFYEVFVCK